MPENIENINDPPDTGGDSSFADNVGGPVKPEPVGIKLILSSILLLIFVGYLVYVSLSDPRAPPQLDFFEK